jgi:hypothetical protein
MQHKNKIEEQQCEQLEEVLVQGLQEEENLKHEVKKLKQETL